MSTSEVAALYVPTRDLKMLRETLCRVQALLQHTIPGGDPAAIFGRALTALLRELERQRCAATTSPRKSRAMTDGSRHIPAAVRREVWRRDDGRCAFVGRNGRCTERSFLEFHHVQPYAAGGSATSDNIQLRCRSHNAYEASLFFGGRQGPDAARESKAAYRIPASTMMARGGWIGRCGVVDPARPSD